MPRLSSDVYIHTHTYSHTYILTHEFAHTYTQIFHIQNKNLHTELPFNPTTSFLGMHTKELKEKSVSEG